MNRSERYFMNGQLLSDKTFGNQNLLPRLPIPALQETCAKFLDLITPILNEAEFHETQQAMQQFLTPGGAGETLHQALLEWDQNKEHKSWLEPLWDDMYLKYRDCVAINSNFAMMFDDLPALVNGQPLDIPVALILQAVRFKQQIQAETLAPDVQRETPLCMKQMRHLFGTCRIPQPGRDRLQTAYDGPDETPRFRDFIVVLHKGSLFSLQVCDETGAAVSPQRIKKGLANILEYAPDPIEGEEVGMLTTMNRDEWAATRAAMMELGTLNRESLEAVERALFVITLDELEPTSLADGAALALHGHGKNRWFDKGFQLHFSPTGKVAINCEHTGYDGDTLKRLLDFLHAAPFPDYETTQVGSGQTSSARLQQLEFEWNDALRATLEKATREFAAFAGNLKVAMIKWDAFGTDKIKSLKMSPDAFMQIAMQTAQWAALGESGSVYEPVMVRHFLHGRTECMRPVTQESLAFARLMSSPDASSPELATALRKSGQKHSNRIRECKNGLGVDRHLYGLQQLASRMGEALGVSPTPAIFESAGWKKMRTDILSTSSAGASSAINVGFGPTSSNGFGVGYMGRKNYLTFTITAGSHMDTEWCLFVENLNKNLLRMANLLEQSERHSGLVAQGR